MMTIPALKTDHLSTMTRAELEKRIVNLEAALEGRAVDLERVTGERDSFKLEVESWKPHVKLNEQLRDALEHLSVKADKEGISFTSSVARVINAYRAVRDGAG